MTFELSFSDTEEREKDITGRKKKHAQKKTHGALINIMKFKLIRVLEEDEKRDWKDSYFIK